MKQVQDLGNDLTLEMREGIYVYHLGSGSTACVDAWADSLIKLLAAWKPGDPPHLSVHDATLSFLSPRIRARTSDIVHANHDIVGRYCIVFPQGLLGAAVRMYVDRDMGNWDHKYRPYFSGRCFSSVADSVEWLHGQKDHIKSPS